jgi:hypothetical protein
MISLLPAKSDFEGRALAGSWYLLAWRPNSVLQFQLSQRLRPVAARRNFVKTRQRLILATASANTAIAGKMRDRARPVMYSLELPGREKSIVAAPAGFVPVAIPKVIFVNVPIAPAMFRQRPVAFRTATEITGLFCAIVHCFFSSAALPLLRQPLLSPQRGVAETTI